MDFKADQLNYKAVTYSSNAEPMTITEQSIPLVKQADGSYNVPPNKILVKVHSAALNPVDLILYRSASKVLSYYNSQQGVGRDYSGTIVAIGEVAAKKTDFSVGDNICGFYRHILGKGTVSEYILLDGTSVKDSAVVPVPRNVSMNEAAAWPLVLGTALTMTQGRIEVGSNAKVLVLGGSTAVGRFCIQLCRNHFKASEIIATCSSSSAPIVKGFGADNTIDYTRYRSLDGPVIQAAGSGKFDLILDCCGNDDLFSSMSKILKPKSKGSHYVSIAGDTKVSYSGASILSLILPSIMIMFRILMNLLGLSSYNYTVLLLEPEKQWAELGRQLIEEEKVKISIDSVYPVENFYDAIKRVESQRANGKVIVQMNE